MFVAGGHLHLRMREMISRKMVQRSPFWPYRQRYASERQQQVGSLSSPPMLNIVYYGQQILAIYISAGLV